MLNVEMPYEQLQEEVFVKYLPCVHKIRHALSLSPGVIDCGGGEGPSPAKYFFVQKDPAIETSGSFCIVFDAGLQARSLTVTFGSVENGPELILHLRP